MGERPDKLSRDGIPGFTRQWREGDEVEFVDGPYRWRCVCEPILADLLQVASDVRESGTAPTYKTMPFFPAAMLDDPGVIDMLEVLRELGPMHVEHLEHHWNERQKAREVNP